MATKANQSLGYKQIPGFLKRLRKEAGLTQEDLGERLKKTQGYVYKSETAIRRVDIGEWIEWCMACGVDPRQAFDELMKIR